MDRLYRHCLIMHQPTAPERAGCLHMLRHTCLDLFQQASTSTCSTYPGCPRGRKGLSPFPGIRKTRRWSLRIAGVASVVIHMG